MNYRHDFHAGNFADVFKHAVLTRILLYLARKPAPFRVIDTHAGSGRYDLGGESATRTREWQGGIGSIDAAAMSPQARALIEPYLALAPPDRPYPGSPALALALTRPFDRMIFCELHPQALAALKTCVGRDKRAKVIPLDGYIGLNAFIPPIERRGLVLIDPPFEAEGEFERLTGAIRDAHAKWRDGIILAWYPVKDRRGPERLAATLAAAEIPDVLRLELQVDQPRPDGRLVSNGLVIVNPPYTLEAEMACLLPELARQLAAGNGGHAIGRIGSLQDG
jgi:23S rRNA (adenine2030-N6)-methyltransferase